MVMGEKRQILLLGKKGSNPAVQGILIGNETVFQGTVALSHLKDLLNIPWNIGRKDKLFQLRFPSINPIQSFSVH